MNHVDRDICTMLSPMLNPSQIINRAVRPREEDGPPPRSFSSSTPSLSRCLSLSLLLGLIPEKDNVAGVKKRHGDEERKDD